MYIRYETTPKTSSEYRLLNPTILEYAVYVDPCGAIYEDGSKILSEVLACCPIRTPMTEQEVLDLRNE